MRERIEWSGFRSESVGAGYMYCRSVRQVLSSAGLTNLTGMLAQVEHEIEDGTTGGTDTRYSTRKLVHHQGWNLQAARHGGLVGRPRLLVPQDASHPLQCAENTNCPGLGRNLVAAALSVVPSAQLNTQYEVEIDGT